MRTLFRATGFSYLSMEKGASEFCGASFIRALILGGFALMTLLQFSSVQSLSHVLLFVTPWTAAHQASLSITNSWSLLKFMSIESMMPHNHLNLCHFLLLLSSIFPSIRVFSNESTLYQVAKVMELQLHHPWFQWSLISFRIDWSALPAVQGTLKSLL